MTGRFARLYGLFLSAALLAVVSGHVIALFAFLPLTFVALYLAHVDAQLERVAKAPWPALYCIYRHVHGPRLIAVRSHAVASVLVVLVSVWYQEPARCIALPSES